MMNPMDEAEVKLPPKYIVTFIMSTGDTLQLPFENDLAITELAAGIELAEGAGQKLFRLESAEPVPSMIQLDNLVLWTPSLARRGEQ
jgi:hypothetical protein